MDNETRENFDRIYNLLTRIEIQCANVNARVDSFKSSIKIGHIFLFIILVIYAGKIWFG